jgi:hypothetical protein
MLLWNSSRKIAVMVLLMTASLLFATPAAAEADANTNDNAANNNPPLVQPEAWQNDLINWLISKPNGYYSDKILWTKTEMGYNMHAAEDIPKNTTLMIIPQAALITSDGTDEECITIVNMMKEYEKGPDSDFYPYIRYLFDRHEGGTSTGLLPSTWSEPAKTLLKTMVGSQLYPQKIDRGQRNVLKTCKKFIDPQMVQTLDKDTAQRWQDAYIFWLSRSWSDKMVPLLDMINHRNGKWLNVESTTVHTGKDIRVYSLRDMVKGEQLWSEYTHGSSSCCSFYLV